MRNWDEQLYMLDTDHRWAFLKNAWDILSFVLWNSWNSSSATFINVALEGFWSPVWAITSWAYSAVECSTQRSLHWGKEKNNIIKYSNKYRWNSTNTMVSLLAIFIYCISLFLFCCQPHNIDMLTNNINIYLLRERPGLLLSQNARCRTFELLNENPRIGISNIVGRETYSIRKFQVW